MPAPHLTPSEAKALTAYRKRLKLVDIVRAILENGEEGLNIAERYALRFQEYDLTPPPPEEVKSLSEYLAPFLSKPKEQLTGKESLVLGLYQLVRGKASCPPLDPPADIEDWELVWWKNLEEPRLRKEKCLQIAEAYFDLAMNKDIALANYWMAYMYLYTVCHQDLDEDAQKKQAKLFLTRARERHIACLLPLEFENTDKPIITDDNPLDFLKKAKEKGLPREIFELGVLAFQKDNSLDLIYEALSLGCNEAALYFAEKFEQEGQLEKAILFYRACAENRQVSAQAQIQKLFRRIDYQSLLVQYHVCMTIFRIDEIASDDYQKALKSLQKLFRDSTIRKELQHQIETFEEDIAGCREETAKHLKNAIGEEKIMTLDYVVSQGNFILTKKLMSISILTTEKKNQLLALAIQSFITLYKTNPEDINPHRYIETINVLIDEGASLSLSRKESKEEKPKPKEGFSSKESEKDETCSSVVTFFYELEKIDLLNKNISKDFVDALSQFIKKLSLSVFQVDDLYLSIVSSLKITIQNWHRRDLLLPYSNLIIGLEKIIKMAPAVINTPEKLHHIPKLTKVVTLIPLLMDTNHRPLAISKIYLSSVSQKDCLNLLIAIASKPRYYASYLKLFDLRILRELPRESLENVEVVQCLLNTSFELWVRYQTAMKILHTLAPDHICYYIACRTLMILFEANQDRLRAPEHIQQIQSDIEQLSMDTVADIFPREENVFQTLKRAIHYSLPDLLKSSLIKIKTRESEWQDQLDILQSQLERWEKNKNENQLHNQQTILLSKSEDREQKKIIKNCYKAHQLYAEKQFDEWNKQINTGKNALDEIQKEKNNLLVLAIKTLSNHYEKRTILINLSYDIDILKSLITSGADINVIISGKSLTGSLLSIIKKIDQDPKIEFSCDDLIKVLGDNILWRNDLYQYIKFVLSREFSSTLLKQDAIKYYDEALIRKPCADLKSLGVFQFFHYDRDLMTECLSLFIQNPLINGYIKHLERDFDKIHYQNQERLLHVAISHKNWIAVKVIITLKPSVINVLIPQKNTIISPRLRELWPTIYEEERNPEKAIVNIIHHILQPLCELSFKVNLETLVISDLNCLRNIIVAVCTAPTLTKAQFDEIVEGSKGHQIISSIFTNLEPTDDKKLEFPSPELAPIIADYCWKWR